MEWTHFRNASIFLEINTNDPQWLVICIIGISTLTSKQKISSRQLTSWKRLVPHFHSNFFLFFNFSLYFLFTLSLLFNSTISSSFLHLFLSLLLFISIFRLFSLHFYITLSQLFIVLSYKHSPSTLSILSFYFVISFYLILSFFFSCFDLLGRNTPSAPTQILISSGLREGPVLGHRIPP